VADANLIRKVYQRYPDLLSKGDVDGIVELYAEDAVVEDPVGSELCIGKDAIRKFYQASAGRVTLRVTGPVRIAGNEAATPMVIRFGPEGQQKALDVISNMSFDDEGRIKSMKAWWRTEDIRSATPDD
jgi:steroid delta-isomerase